MSSGRDRFLQLRQAAPVILPSMLNCNFGNLEREVELLEDAGVAGLHLDVMDGVFVPNFSFGLTIISAFRSLTDLPLDVHLMMVHPENYIRQFCDAGADCLTIHAEAMQDPRPTLDQIRDLGVASGIAINPGTPVSDIESCLPHCDLVLVMSVQAGFGGQSFQAEVLPKFQQIRELAGGQDVVLEIDGGVNPDTIGMATEHGAQLMVAGSAIVKQDDYAAALETMMSRIKV